MVIGNEFRSAVVVVVLWTLSGISAEHENLANVIEKRGQFVASYKQIYEKYAHLKIDDHVHSGEEIKVNDILSKSLTSSLITPWDDQMRKHATFLNRFESNLTPGPSTVQEVYALIHFKYMAFRGALDFINGTLFLEKSDLVAPRPHQNVGETLLAFAELGMQKLFNILLNLLKDNESHGISKVIKGMITSMNQFIKWYGYRQKVHLSGTTTKPSNKKETYNGLFHIPYNVRKKYYTDLIKEEKYVWECVVEMERLFTNINFNSTDNLEDAEPLSLEDALNLWAEALLLSEENNKLGGSEQYCVQMIIAIESWKLMKNKIYTSDQVKKFRERRFIPVHIAKEKIETYLSTYN